MSEIREFRKIGRRKRTYVSLSLHLQREIHGLPDEETCLVCEGESGEEPDGAAVIIRFAFLGESFHLQPQRPACQRLSASAAEKTGEEIALTAGKI